MQPSNIRTPDQRLRVFVSSTLGELATERRAVRAAIEQLRLTPVMFELGARSHPPRELYRAYLAQSHVFVGIYWQRYGWIAPGESVSGLEDEYRLAGDRPRLLYIREPAPEREPRLAELIAGFQADDRASYKPFSSSDELRELVSEDLAVLLSERFEHPGVAPPHEPTVASTPPVPLTQTFGRSEDVARIAEALAAGRRLITLTGPGGIGKTRLALEVAHLVADRYRDGVHFVPLAAVADADRALRTLAESLGLRTEGSGVPADAVARQLRGRCMLLVLDNVEQIAGLGPAITGLLERLPDLQVLVTSRRALRVRPEQEVGVGPLLLPDPRLDRAWLVSNPAVQLFVDRARAVVPGFALTDELAPIVAELCRRVDGLPLAIELAAARVRVMPPRALLDRLGEQLDVLAGGGEDLPERQRTLRATIDWSHQLLDERAQALFARLSVFAGGWTLEAAEALYGTDHSEVPGTLASLVDGSLVVSDLEESTGELRFRFLGTVRRYAAERLAELGETEVYLARHLDWCRELAERAQPFLCGPGQPDWVRRMDPERANLRRAVETALALGDHPAVVELAWDVVVYYFVRDAVDEPDSWLQRVAATDPQLDEITDAKLRSLLALTRIHHGDYREVHRSLLEPLEVFRAHGMDFEAAVALHQLGFVHYRLDRDTSLAIADLEESSRTFDAVDHDWGVALAEAMLGSVFASTGELEAAEQCQRRSLERARRIGSDQQIVQAQQQLALIRLLERREDEALELLREAAPAICRGHYRTDASYGLDALAVVALARDDVLTAARAATTAQAVRDQLGIGPWPTLEEFIERVRRATRRRVGDAEFDERIREAHDADPFATLTEVLDALDTDSVA